MEYEGEDGGEAMRELSVEEITRAVAELCQEANWILGADWEAAMTRSIAQEESPVGKECLQQLLENASLARSEHMPICQDTGMAIVFVDLGQEVAVVGGDFYQAIRRGVAQGYGEGYLRASIVESPFKRVNTGDNTPPVIHLQMVPGDKLSITVAPKGFGSENKSALRMLTPSQGIEGVEAFVLECVLAAGASPCPPVIVGVGVGGTMEIAALKAKHALLRPIGSHHSDSEITALEERLLEKINNTGIGPQGLGGRTTALGVMVETYPTHIAGLPVAVNISCHVLRHRSCTL